MTSNLKQDQGILNHSDRFMALMILSLHGLLVLGDRYHLYGALFLCHYGLFLLWQPIMRQTKHLSAQAIVVIMAGAALATFFISWWVIAFWIAGLFALIGGRVFANESQQSKLPNILAAAYLIAVLLLSVVPNLMTVSGDLAAADFLVIYALPLLPLAILILSTQNKPQAEAPNIDFFYTLLIFLLTLIVILGCFAIGVIWKIHYIELLLIVIFGMSATLVAISWLWNPSASFSGLEMLMSRYLLSLGLPFEQWVKKIALHSVNNNKAENFLEDSVIELAKLDWVVGVDWTSNQNRHSIGSSSKFVSSFNFHELQLTLYARWQLSPAMYLHVQLLTQVLAEFYEAKRREETITQNTYVQSLYETGSRLTHDIKNILQSLGTLSSAIELSKGQQDDAKLMTLLRKQLPRLNQRISSTLNKLEQPNIEHQHKELLSAWWKGFTQLNKHTKIKFEQPTSLAEIYVDTDVADSIADNLLQNALEKIKQEADATIKVQLLDTPHFCLEVSDSGSAIPAEIAKQLFKSHISGSRGLGVGLYHAAQQAAQSGYILTLAENQNGTVRFRLESN